MSIDDPFPDTEVTITAGQPHSKEAEEAVVGAILINPEAYYDVASFLTGQDFYIHRIRFVWDAFVRLHERRVPVDILTVSDELTDMGRLEEIGGQAYLTALLNQVPTTLHIEAYGKIVQAAAIRRKLLAVANQIATLAYDQTKDIDEISVNAIAAVGGAVNAMLIGQQKTSRQAFAEAYDRIDILSRQPADVLPGISTGLVDLTNLLGGGWKPGKLYVAAGRPGQGKTSFLLTTLKYAAYECGKTCAVFSLEMTTEELVDRLISIDQGIDGQLVSTGKLTDEQWPSFCQAIETGGDTNIFFDDTPALSPIQIRARCERIKAQFGLDMVFIDYLGLLSPDEKKNNREQEVSSISRSLKTLARVLGVPVVCAHQLSRAVEERSSNEPILSDLRDSGSVEQDSDVVVFLYQDKETPNISYAKIAKQRGGPTGHVDLLFRRNITKFESLKRL